MVEAVWYACYTLGMPESVSQTERLCKQALDFYLPFLKRMDNIRPPYLMGLEFDRLYPEIKAAIEFQGIQHGRSIEFFHNETQQFHHQLTRDRDKLVLAQQQGIRIFAFSDADADPLLFERRVKELVNYGRYVAREQQNQAMYDRLTYVSFNRRPADDIFAAWQKIAGRGMRGDTVQAKQRRMAKKQRRSHPILGFIGRWGYYILQALFQSPKSRRRSYH
jgi:hypothetical protein